MMTSPHWLMFVSVGLALMNIVQGIVLTLRRETNEERKALIVRVEKMENTTSNHDQRIQGIVLENERQRDDVTRSISRIQADLGQLPTLSIAVATLSTEIKHLALGIDEIKATLAKRTR